MLSLMWKPGRHVHIYKTAQHRDNETIKKDAFVWGICVTLPTAGLKLPLAHLFGLRSCKRLLHLRGPLLYPPLYKPSEKHHKTDKTGCIQSVPHVSSAGPEGSYMHTHAHIWPRGEKKKRILDHVDARVVILVGSPSRQWLCRLRPPSSSQIDEGSRILNSRVSRVALSPAQALKVVLLSCLSGHTACSHRDSGSNWGETATKNQSPSDQGSGRRSVKVSKSTSCKRPQQTLEIKALLTTLALCNPPSKKQCVAFSGLNWQKCNVIMFLPRVFNQNKALIKNRWESPTSQLVDSKSNTLETSNKFGSLGTKFMHGRNNK